MELTHRYTNTQQQEKFPANYLIIFLLTLAMPFVNIWDIGGTKILNLFQIALVLGCYYLAVLNTPIVKTPYNKIRSKTLLYYAIFCLAALIPIISAKDIDLALDQTALNLQLLFIFYILSKIVSSNESVEWIYKALLAGFLLSIFIALMQYLKVKGFQIYSDKDLNTNTQYVTENQLIDVLRIWGPFGNALTFSLYLSVTGIVLFYYLRFCKKQVKFAWVIFILTILGIFVTISRTALAAFFIVFFIIEFLLAKKSVKVVYLITSVVLFVVVSSVLNVAENSNVFLNRLLASQDDFKEGRLNLWLTGFKVLNDNLLFGSGPGNLGLELAKKGWVYEDSKAMRFLGTHVENYYLTLLFTYGSIPFLFYGSFVVNYFSTAYKLFRNSIKSPDYSHALAVPVFAGLIVFFINNLSNPILISDFKIQLLFIILLVVIVFKSKEQGVAVL